MGTGVSCSWNQGVMACKLTIHRREFDVNKKCEQWDAGARQSGYVSVGAATKPRRRQRKQRGRIHIMETLDVIEMLPSKFEPKKVRQFILQIEGIDAFLVKSAQRPTFETDVIEIPWINSTRKLAGKTKFNEIQVELHDPIAPSGAQQVMEWLRLCYEAVSGRAGYAEMYKRDIQIKLLDPVGTVIECWDLKGAWVKTANFGDLKYEEATGLVGVTLTIVYDVAVLQY